MNPQKPVVLSLSPTDLALLDQAYLALKEKIDSSLFRINAQLQTQTQEQQPDNTTESKGPSRLEG